MLTRRNVLCKLDKPIIVPFSEAADQCGGHGGAVASLQQFQRAFDTGYAMCKFSWLNDGLLYSSVQVASAAGNCNTVGVLTHPFPQTTANVNCVFEDQSTVKIQVCWPL